VAVTTCPPVPTFCVNVVGVPCLATATGDAHLAASVLGEQAQACAAIDAPCPLVIAKATQ
jgi:hypothetical protein